jgi:hypothetical protein
MEIRKFYIVIGLVLALAFFLEIVANAEDTSQEMTIRFSSPVQIPGQVLPAGTYRFKPAESDDSVVQVFNAEGTHLYATLQTIPAQRSIVDDDLVVTVAARKSDNPDFLVKWFDPGSLVGHEFVYSKAQQQQVADETYRTSVGSQVLPGTPVDGN